MAKQAQTLDFEAKQVRKGRPRHTPGKGAPVRADGRRAMLVYLDEDVILQIKAAALVQKVNAYEIIEEAARAWLHQRTMPKDNRF